MFLGTLPFLNPGSEKSLRILWYARSMAFSTCSWGSSTLISTTFVSLLVNSTFKLKNLLLQNMPVNYNIKLCIDKHCYKKKTVSSYCRFFLKNLVAARQR